MTHPRKIWGLVWLTAICLQATAICLQATAIAEQPTADATDKGKLEAENNSQGFLRIRKNADGEPLAMETAVVRYEPANNQRAGLKVDLIGAVHVGDQSYYEQLNELFESYDAVLYELVAPEGTRIPKGGRKTASGHPITALQLGMKNMLELEYQLDLIDYTKDNLIHADMSPEEFAKSMEDRDESFLKMFFRMLGQSAAMQARGTGPSDADFLLALFSENRALKFKQIIAQQFEDMETLILGMSGPDGSTIITERNKKALEVLKREIDNGKQSIAIFYGAGHLPDMDQRLIDDLDMKRTKTSWLSAWSLTGDSSSGKE